MLRGEINACNVLGEYFVEKIIFWWSKFPAVNFPETFHVL
jgi:hypothetical protein